MVSPGHDWKLPALIAFNHVCFLGAPALACKYSMSAAVLGRSYAFWSYSVVRAGQVGSSTFNGMISCVGVQGT